MEWQQIIKLGKNTIVRLLQELEVSFNEKANYFFLCKLYRDFKKSEDLTVGDVFKDLEVNLNHSLNILNLNHQFGVRTSKKALNEFFQAADSFISLVNSECNLGLAID